jgi:hypothetical protein
MSNGRSTARSRSAGFRFPDARRVARKPEQSSRSTTTFRIDFLRRDKFTLPDIGVPVPAVINSGAAKSACHRQGPGAMEWLKNSEAGGGLIDK